MSDDFQNIVTGTLTYKDIDFTFVFDRTELRLIPPKEKARDVSYWTKRPLGNGIYTFGDPVLMEESFLVGKCNEGLADALYPPQDEPIIIDGRKIKVGVDQYINRLVQFISSKQGSKTYKDVVGTDLSSIISHFIFCDDEQHFDFRLGAVLLNALVSRLVFCRHLQFVA